jgi:crotonobetainyl-CoA:carnitine CoA-transferase CaiB-like acyl-CoA transferase
MNPIHKVAELIGVSGFEEMTVTQAMEGRDEIRWAFAEAFPAKTTDEWLEILLAEDIWCAPVNDLEAAVNDPQVTENEMIIEWEHPTAGKVRTTGIAIKFSDTPGAVFRPAPNLGEHTRELLQEVASFSSDEIDNLVAEGAVR